MSEFAYLSLCSSIGISPMQVLTESSNAWLYPYRSGVIRASGLIDLSEVDPLLYEYITFEPISYSFVTGCMERSISIYILFLLLRIMSEVY